MNYYLKLATGRIDIYNGVSGVVGFSDTLEDEDLIGLDNIQLSENQISRYETQKSQIEAETRANYDLNYIFTGVATPEPVKTLEQLKEEAKTTLGTNLYMKLIGGCTYDGNIFNYDEDTTMNIVKQKTRSLIDDEEDLFKISDRTKVQREFTRLEFAEFSKTFTRYIAPLEEEYSHRKNRIDLATDETELGNINLEFAD